MLGLLLGDHLVTMGLRASNGELCSTSCALLVVLIGPKNIDFGLNALWWWSLYLT